jgi:cytoskeletal protein CcmA (bactofilin family)
MAPLFQRRSVIGDDEPDYSVRARYSTHGAADGGVRFSPPPAPIYSPPPPPMQAAPPPPPLPVIPSRLKVSLGGLTDHARDLTRQLTDAGRVRIATIAGRLAKTLSDADPPPVPFAPVAASAGEAGTSIETEDRRWREYEAAQRDETESLYPEPQADIRAPAEDEAPSQPAVDVASELLRMRAVRVLTAGEAEVEPQPVESPAPGGQRGKYGMLIDQVGNEIPQNWGDLTPEEPQMQEEHTNGAQTDARARSVKLDGDSNTIDITRESRFSGQLKFSGTLIIEGEVEGELEATRIVVREGGTASARILGDSITVSGKVNDDVIARRNLEMTSTGRLHGDVTAPEMKLHPGATIKRRCSIGEAA